MSHQISHQVNRNVLFTNLQSVSHGDMEADAHALLLSHQRWDDSAPNVFTATGFGTECAARIFTVHLNSIEWTVYNDTDESGRPLTQRKTLKIHNGPKFKLMLSDVSRPLNVIEYDAPEVGKIEADLTEWVARYWRGSYMQAQVWAPATSHVETLRVARQLSALLQSRK